MAPVPASVDPPEAKPHHGSTNNSSISVSQQAYIRLFAYPDDTLRPLLDQLDSGNTHRKNANDGLDSAEYEVRVHWLAMVRLVSCERVVALFFELSFEKIVRVWG